MCLRARNKKIHSGTDGRNGSKGYLLLQTEERSGHQERKRLLERNPAG